MVSFYSRTASVLRVLSSNMTSEAMQTTKRTKPQTAGWVDIDPRHLPLPILGMVTRLGNTVTKAQARQVVCRWDGAVRDAYRTTSSTGRCVEWVPCDRAQTSWNPKLVK